MTYNLIKNHCLYLGRDMVIIVCFFISPILLAQEQISFGQFSVKDGLSQNSAISVTQDSTGYLWIATQNGLNKYDGKSIKTYPLNFVDITRPSYSHLGKVYVDRMGNVFAIPLDKKLYKYDSANDRFYQIPNIEDASCVFQDSGNTYWIGTYSRGLMPYNANFEQPTPLSEDNFNSVIYSISQLSDGTIVATSESKLLLVDITNYKSKVVRPENLLGEPIRQNFSKAITDKDGRLWLCTFGDGLYYKEANQEIFHRISENEFKDPLPNTLNILDVYLASSEKLWIATYGDGLYLLDFKTQGIRHFKADKYNPRAIHYNDILCIYEDYTGAVWFGTDGAGLSFYDASLDKFNSFTNLQTPENISIEVIRAIAVDSLENVWLGTSGKGLTSYEPATNSWRTFTTLNSDLPSDRIMSLFLDPDGDLWIGTQGSGLVFYNEKGGFRKVPNLGLKTIWDIYQDSQSRRIWLGTQNQGLIQYDKRTGILKRYTSETTGLTSNNIRVIEEGNNSDLWIGTDDAGIMNLNLQNEILTLFQKGDNNSLSGNEIKSLHFDHKEGVLWIGLNGSGLNALDLRNQKFHHYTEKEGLANDVIYAILPDRNNNLWLSSNKGITKFSMDSSLTKPVIKNYNNYAGLATEFNTGAYFKHTNGTLYYGGLEGYYWFDPEKIEENAVLPKTTITGLEVYSQSRPLHRNTELKHNENTISLTFSSLQYALPEKNQYQFRLLNYDDDWIIAHNNTSARYSRLPPGEYEFQVKSSNYDGIWNQIPARFPFKIKAPWYFNTVSKLLYLLLLLGSLYGIYYYLRWRWRMRLNLQLQEEEAARLKQLNNYKSKLYTDVAHEFRTPLTLISAPIDAKLTEGSLSDFDFANFSGIRRNINRLTALVDQLLQLAKLEKGKQRLRLTKGNLGLFLHSIVEPFAYKASLKNIRFKNEITETDSVWYDEDVIEKIVTNLLSNAIKYTPKGGDFGIISCNENGHILIKLENSLQVDDAIETEKIFDRFYQKDEHAEGVGVGLSLVQELVKLCKGSIEVFSHSGKIIFKVKLPVIKEAFDPEELHPIGAPETLPEKSLSDYIDKETNAHAVSTNEKPILLIVEDNNEVRDFVCRSLRHKYDILQARNGEEGIQQTLDHVPDIVLSDVRMPIKNGIELCNTLKTDERTSHIPVILLTADSREENELQSLESGADDFITKPFKLRILEKRLSNLVELRRALRKRYSQEYVLKPTEISLTSTDEAFLNRLQKIIDEELTNSEFNAATFSKKIGMSRMQLHRKLLAYTGLSTTAFIRSQRLKQAAHLLKTTDATMNEVAYTVGFNTPAYFFQCFKETYRKTPTEYRQFPF